MSGQKSFKIFRGKNLFGKLHAWRRQLSELTSAPAHGPMRNSERRPSEWDRTDEQFTLRVTIPVGATAMLFMPARDSTSVKENGSRANGSDGIKFLRIEASAAVFALGSGNYEFTDKWRIARP